MRKMIRSTPKYELLQTARYKSCIVTVNNIILLRNLTQTYQQCTRFAPYQSCRCWDSVRPPCLEAWGRFPHARTGCWTLAPSQHSATASYPDSVAS